MSNPHSISPVYPQDRRFATAAVEIADGGATSGAVFLGHFGTGLVKCPAGVVGPLTFTASPTEGGTYTLVNAVSLVINVAAEWHEIPASVMKAGWVKFVNGAGNVAGDQTVNLLLKT